MDKQNTLGSFDFSPKRNGGFQSVVDFIHHAIPEFIEEAKMQKITVEDGLTQVLCEILVDSTKDDFPYIFLPQNMEDPQNGNSPRTDFAVKTRKRNKGDHRKPFVQFEAKRLCCTLGKARDKEYAIGQYGGNQLLKNSGGIERFKNGTHGKTVIYAGLIGYVQDHSSKYWARKANQWISEEISQPHDPTLIWDKDDLLAPEFEKENHCQFFSLSQRRENQPLSFVHLWINLLT